MGLKQVKVPFPMPPAIPEETREEFMKWAVRENPLSKNLPRLRPRGIGDGTLTIIGYGPSLADTWSKIKPPLITTSRALKFLIEKGLEPGPGWYHAAADPRVNCLEFITPPAPGVIYLMASVCHPKTWSRLKGHQVVMWHAISGEHTPDWVSQNDPGTMLIGAGSTIGLCAVHLGGCLGYRHFEIHGFDGCFRDGKRHAGEHNGHDQAAIFSAIDPTYTTSKIMENANVEVQNMLRSFPIFCVFHGDGLMQSWVRKENLHNAAVDGTAHADEVRSSRYIPIPMSQAVKLKEKGIPIL